MNTHTHSLSTALYKRNAQQYKGRGNSLQYESAWINILYNFHFYNVQVKSWETPNLHLVNFHNFSKLSCLACRHLCMVAAWLTNPSFTLSHDRVVFPTRAHLQVATHGRLQPRHTYVHNPTHQQVFVHTCMMGGRSLESPRHPREAFAQTRHHTSTVYASPNHWAHLHPQPSSTPSSVWLAQEWAHV